MIGISLRGQTGNQLFQYAAARFQAERTGRPLLINTKIGRRRALSQLTTGKLKLLGTEFSTDIRQSVRGRLIQFTEEFSNFCPFDKFKFDLIFKPFEVNTINSWKFETYDERIHSLNTNVLLEGYFQSAKYFNNDKDYISYIYGPNKSYLMQLRSLLLDYGIDIENSVAVHVRRGDYLRMREPYSNSDTGWALPIQYYRKALNILDKKIKPVFISTDYEFIRYAFGQQAICSPFTDASRDMMLMALCRYKVLSNSTFAWWGAYLGGIHDKLVIAPKYWMGWEHGRWMPEGIEVEGWRYIDAESEKDTHNW
jgi:hypothetical protein